MTARRDAAATLAAQLPTHRGRAAARTPTVLSLVFVVYRLAEPRLRRARVPAGAGLAVAAGATSGVTSAVAHAGGPPVAVYPATSLPASSTGRWCGWCPWHC